MSQKELVEQLKNAIADYEALVQEQEELGGLVCKPSCDPSS